MCQGDLGARSVLTPFEEDAAGELISSDGERTLPVKYSARVARLALALHDLIEAVRAQTTLPLQVTRQADQAELILEEESVAARRGLEAGEVV